MVIRATTIYPLIIVVAAKSGSYHDRHNRKQDNDAVTEHGFENKFETLILSLLVTVQDLWRASPSISWVDRGS